MTADFEIVQSTFANGVHPITKYRSKTTGLTLVHAEVKGPMVNGYIVLGTFPEDDDGLPHTLEHLIFLGSVKYPYKGILDLLAGKCASNGTNAWTDSDHTCYTLTTAGQNGFCCLLPIYLDHVFFPTLEESAFATEVHHVDGNGEDNGVVYSEQQAKEHSPESMSHVELCRILYPPTSGYHYVSGGVLKNLRDSCNNVKVRNFHKKFYSPKNATIIVCGIVNSEKLLLCLTEFTKNIVEKGDFRDVEKSWNNEVPHLDSPVVRIIEYPAAEENEACVTVGFRGPSVATHLEESVGIRILFSYLADTSVAPLQMAFIECPDPLCSAVSYGELENSEPIEFFEFEEVAREQAHKVPALLRRSLENQLQNFEKSRMDACIRTQIQDELSSMENNSRDAIAYCCITDFLYGKGNPQMFEKRLNVSAICKNLLNHSKQDWVNMIQELILNQHWVTVIALSSIKAHQNLKTIDEDRTKQRVAKLGKAGLDELKTKLTMAERKNRENVPANVLKAIQTPKVRSIDFHNITRSFNPAFSKDFACNVFLDDINSRFIYVTAHLDTTRLPREHRKYLALYLESLTESEILGENDSTIIDYQDVIEGLSQDLVNVISFFGVQGSVRFVCGEFNHIMSFNLQFEIEKVDLGFKWLRRILTQVHWTSDRLSIIASKMISEINQIKRNGPRIAKALLQSIIFKDESNTKCLSLIRQQMFLKQLRASLPANEVDVISILKEIRSIVTDPAHVTLQIATSVPRMKDALLRKKMELRLVLRQMFPYKQLNDKSVKCIANTPDTFWMNDIRSTAPTCVIMGLASEESGCLYQVSQGISDKRDPDFPALRLAIQYFIQTEGPFYRAIRGGGYAYDYTMFPSPSKGLIIFQLLKCASTVGAYRASQDTIIRHLENSSVWNQNLLVSAQSSLICEIIDEETTPLKLAEHSLTCSYNNVGLDYSRRQTDSIQKVTLTEVKRVTKQYLEPLFLKPTNCAVVVPIERVQKVAEEFEKIGKRMSILPPIEESILAEWKF